MVKQRLAAVLVLVADPSGHRAPALAGAAGQLQKPTGGQAVRSSRTVWEVKANKNKEHPRIR